MILAGPPQVTVELVKDGIQTRLERTRKQVELLDEMIDQAEDADTLDALTRSKERLFRIWAHLAGIPNPGSLKPSQPRQQQRSATVEPIGPAPTQSHVQSNPGASNPGPGQAGPGPNNP
jgi:hypothetical protein